MSDTKLEYLGAGISAVVSAEHTFGTDALLLANFAAPKKSEKACDLGTGCGIIPLLWCRDERTEKITAVEIQPAACEQVQAAIEQNSLREKLEIVNADLRELKGKLTLGAWDLVTMNPPYKAANTGIKSRGEAELIARHEVLCTLEEIAKAAAELLKFGGRFCLCHRPERLCDVFAAMREAGIEPKRLRLVAQANGKAPWLILAEGKKGGKPGLNIEPQLVIKNDNGEYTDEMRAVYGEYAEH
jgi:tRNA1(Val) A37 N6-methylase TrmN6